jgi:hypothetical protein
MKLRILRALEASPPCPKRPSKVIPPNKRNKNGCRACGVKVHSDIFSEIPL